MPNWSNEPQPFGANHAPLLTGVSSSDGVTPVPIAVDPATGRVLTNSTGTVKLNPESTTSYHLVSAASNNATNVKASAGTIWNVQSFNNSSTIYYLKLYDKASAPAPASDTPIKTLLIPHNAGQGAGFILPADSAITFTTGIAFAIVGGISDTDNTSCASNAVVINFDYA